MQRSEFENLFCISSMVNTLRFFNSSIIFLCLGLSRTQTVNDETSLFLNSDKFFTEVELQTKGRIIVM